MDDEWLRVRLASPEYLFWLSRVMDAYIAWLLGEGVPLTAPLSVACMLADFCALTGIVPPPAIEECLSIPQRRELANRIIWQDEGRRTED